MAVQQSALTKKLLEGDARLIEMVSHLDAFWKGQCDGRRIVEAVLREAGYALPKSLRDDPLWLWAQRLTLVQWTYYPQWMARPLVGNLCFFGPNSAPDAVGIVLKAPTEETHWLQILRGDREDRRVDLDVVHGYLVPPDGCKSCVQRSALLRRE